MNEFKNRLRTNLSHAFPKQTVSQDSFGDIWIKVGEQESIEEAYTNFFEAYNQLPDINLPPEKTRIFFFKKDKSIFKIYVIDPATYDFS
ncbi:MAG: hypothetical protein JWN56_3082 [Sphingobacteriales bacterium]|nr:hypothetical protein [Sphingobacteriales bacterium]